MIDNSDIAAAALKPDHRGKCSCYKNDKLRRPKPNCEKCNGTGVVTACSKCEGSGWNAQTQQQCSKCGGSGYLRLVS